MYLSVCLRVAVLLNDQFLFSLLVVVVTFPCLSPSSDHRFALLSRAEKPVLVSSRRAGHPDGITRVFVSFSLSLFFLSLAFSFVLPEKKKQLAEDGCLFFLKHKSTVCLGISFFLSLSLSSTAKLM